MLPYNKNHLSLASGILLSRLTRPTTLDVNIYYDLIPNVKCNIERELGRFIGCFDIRPDGLPCFYLAGREHPDKKITHLFVFYMNSNYKVIQEFELNRLKNYLPGIENPECNIKIGIINVVSSANCAAYLSILLEAIVFMIGPNLFEQFVNYQVINTDIRDLVIGTLKDCKLSHCDGIIRDDIIDEFKELANKHSIEFSVYPNDGSLLKSELALINIRGHLVGSIYCKESKIVNYILVHRNQLEDDETYDELKRISNSWYCNVRDYCCTRLYPNKFIRCDSKFVQDALDLALQFRPHVLTTIHENELNYLSNKPIRSSVMVARFERIVPKLNTMNSLDLSQIDADCITQLNFSSDDKYPDIVSNYDSQATIILSDHEIRSELSYWREIANERKTVKDSIVPPVHGVKPFTDLSQSYLKFLPCFEEAVEFIAKIWSSFAKTIVFPMVRLRIDRQYNESWDARFVIYPLESHLDKTSIIIFDVDKKESIHLQYGNVEHKDPDYFKECGLNYLKILFPELNEYKCKPVPIGSLFHEDYPRLHLLMALYVISRLFKYSIQLPNKIIYGEWELRKYASNICSELQLVNSEYNMKNDLIDHRGYLKEGAYESLPSPIVYETCVVPKDLCMFCKRRGFNNLGRHMSMAHGGQALFASSSRFKG